MNRTFAKARGSLVVVIAAAAALAASAPPPGSAGVSPASSPPPPAPESEPAAPSNPREFFNIGTQKLRLGKLREAEAFLESALASQTERLQAPGLYNLGHVRFGQGIEELKKGPGGRPTAARAHNASQAADEATRAADEALAANELDKMVASY